METGLTATFRQTAGEVRGTIIRIKSEGLYLKPDPKSAAGHRRLLLPSWGIALLQRRFSASPIVDVPILDRLDRDTVSSHLERHRLLFPSLRQTLRDPSNTDPRPDKPGANARHAAT